jgi:LEA14-like dessication related protein
MRSIGPSRVWAVSAVLVAAGCAEVKDFVGRAFERPTLSFQSVALEGLDLEGVTVSLHYRIDNPNSVGLSLAKLGYALDVEGHRTVAGELPSGVRIPAQGSAPLVVPVRLLYRELPQALAILATRSEVGYRVSGHVGVDTPVGIIDLPFEHQGRAPVPRPPTLSIESARITATSVTRIGLTLRLRVQNSNAFALPAGSLQYALSIAGSTVVSTESCSLSRVSAGGNAILELPLTIDTLGAARTAARALSGEPLEIAVQGTAGYGSVRLPLQTHGQVAPRR